MKIPHSLFSLSVLCVTLAASDAGAQSSFNSGVAGSNPFGRVYAPPANAQQPAQALPVGPGGYTGGGVNPAASLAYYNEPVEPNHKLNRGDRLSYQVAEDRDPKPPEGLVVTDSGDVNIPLLGPVHAAGMTVPEFTARVKSSLEKEYYYHATVLMGLDSVVPRQSRGRVYVTGAVRNPGAVELPLDEPLSVSKAIIKAGDFKDFGDKNHVKILHKGGDARGTIVNVNAVLKGKSADDPALQAGDTVVVPESIIHF